MASTHFCSRCGCTVDPDNGLSHPAAHGQTTWRVNCAVCKVDRVLRWGDLVRASIDMTDCDVRRQLEPFGATNGLATALSDAGLVAYNSGDLAWELTADGGALLALWDASR